MAQKYYNSKETAKLLGITVDEVKQMLERRELYGYRDGADWKFKTEDIDRKAKERAEESAGADDDQGDVLLSEIELGASDPGLSGTVIGGNQAKKVANDLRMADSEIKLADSGIQLADDKPAAKKKDAIDSKVSQFEELDLTLDQDLSLDDSDIKSKPGKGRSTGDSAVDLSGKELDDDDLVLGGSGTGSDITIGGDSGISLVDPADSGLSLEEPLNLASTSEESLELGEDDMLTMSADTGGTGIGSQLKGSEDDFQLTPMEDLDEGEDSESGSQVIALDTEGDGDDAATMISGPGGAAALLDEDLGGEPLGLAGGMPMGGMGQAAMVGGHPTDFAMGAPFMQSGVLLPEAPYTIWNIVGLALCSLILVLVGMMMFDLMKNMWSWDHVQPINSSIMDSVLGLFEK